MTSDRSSKGVSTQSGDELVARCDSQNNRDLLALIKARQAAATEQVTPTVASAKPVATQGRGASSPGVSAAVMQEIQEIIAARKRK